MVAPSQTLDDHDYNMLRNTAIKVSFRIDGLCAHHLPLLALIPMIFPATLQSIKYLFPRAQTCPVSCGNLMLISAV